MNSILLRSLIFIGFIIFGYLLKYFGVCNKQSYKKLSVLVLNFTLPCAVISAFSGFTPELSLFFFILIGFLGNVFMVALGFLLTRGDTRETKVFYVLNLAGYNIGCFAMPFAQAILGPLGVVATCLFDVGNSLMCTGLTYSLLDTVLPANKEGKQQSTFAILKKLFLSIPFDTYVIMTILVYLGIQLPDKIVYVAQKAGHLNGYLAMTMLGLMLEFTTNKVLLKLISKVLIIRHVVSILCALGAYFLLPFSLELRQVLTIAFLAPITIIAAVFADKLECNVQLSSLAASFSISFSVIVITVLLMII